MTYCFAFKYDNDVFLYSDSAITTNQYKTVPVALTSFGESTVQRKDTTTFEAILKIYQTSSHSAIAYAGDVEVARTIINILKNCYQFDHTLEKRFELVSSRLGHKVFYVELLIADYSKDGNLLCKWNTADRELISIEECASTGSLSAAHDQNIKSINKSLIDSGKYSKDAMLSIMAAVIQSNGLKNYLMEDGIGGSVLGAQISKNRVHWLPDTIYVISNHNAEPENQASLVYREGGLAVYSSYSQGINYFVSSDDEPSEFDEADKTYAFREWLKKWPLVIDKQIHSFLYENWVFINPFTDVIMIVRSDFLVSKTTVSHFSVKDGFLRAEINGNLQYLLQKLEPGTITFSSNFVVKKFVDDTYYEIRFKEEEKAILDKFFKN